jgi:cell division septation protein DedD
MQARSSKARSFSLMLAILLLAALPLVAQTPDPTAPAQPASAPAPQPAPINISPVAIVSLSGSATVTGALQVTGGRALIAASGTVAAGSSSTDVLLPNRGTLRVCASTTVKLAADSSAPSGDLPGVMMAIDHGAIEASFTTVHNADTVLTPDFRILIGGPGAANVKIRLGDGGDTCVDNPRTTTGDAPYVLVTSVFDGSLYRVQSGQRAMFQHGSIHEVVDQEKESCGCPPTPAETTGNEFPLAQSEGLAPTPAPTPAPVQPAAKPATPAPPLVYNAGETPAAAAPPTAPPATGNAAASAPSAQPAPQPAPKKPGFFTRVGHFFKRIFGAE